MIAASTFNRTPVFEMGAVEPFMTSFSWRREFAAKPNAPLEMQDGATQWGWPPFYAARVDDYRLPHSFHVGVDKRAVYAWLAALPPGNHWTSDDETIGGTNWAMRQTRNPGLPWSDHARWALSLLEARAARDFATADHWRNVLLRHSAECRVTREYVDVIGEIY